MLEVFADGSSLGNPGNAGAGVVIYKDKKVVAEESVYLGTLTNNFAEYAALILGLQRALQFSQRPVYVYMDSELVVKQMQGKYKVKDKHLYPLNIIAKNLMAIIEDCTIFHKYREENERADALAKKAASLGKKAKTAHHTQKTLFD
ncbi:ribonuclease HI family protein [Candidatus Omnitrophota bacterium]